MIITLVFPTFGFCFHNAIHEVISVIPAWRSNTRRETEGLLRSIQVSSANRDTPGLRTWRSLTKAKKSFFFLDWIFIYSGDYNRQLPNNNRPTRGKDAKRYE